MFNQVLWFATRGAGAVALLMFTASTALGLVTVARFQAAGWPRFFNYEMHRRVALLSIVFLAIHIVTAVLDPFTNLGLSAALVPLASTYRPVPVAIGVVAFYLFVALIASSLLRQRIGHRTWRAIHWASYAMWPMALLHGITAGTDAFAFWMVAIDLACMAAVAGCLAWRISAGNPNRSRLGDVVASSSWQPVPSRGDVR